MEEKVSKLNEERIEGSQQFKNNQTFEFINLNNDKLFEFNFPSRKSSKLFDEFSQNQDFKNEYEMQKLKNPNYSTFFFHPTFQQRDNKLSLFNQEKEIKENQKINSENQSFLCSKKVKEQQRFKTLSPNKKPEITFMQSQNDFVLQSPQQKNQECQKQYLNFSGEKMAQKLDLDFKFSDSFDPKEVKNLFSIGNSQNFPMRSRTTQRISSQDSFNGEYGSQNSILYNPNVINNPYQSMDFSEDLSSDTLLGKKISVRLSQFQKNFQIIDLIGTGNSGRVYKCLNKFDNMIYAVKIIENRNKEAIQESQSLASLNFLYGYEYFLRYFTSWIESQTAYIVMEFCPSTLSQLTSFEENDFKKVILDICEGLQKCHQTKVVHLDIKPDNILLSENGNYKLSDLGLMKSLNDENDITTLREGDSRYMAKELLDVTPSQILNNEIDLTKADIFSLGMSIYQMMTKSDLPRNGVHWNQLRENRIDFSNFQNFSQSTMDLLKSMLDQDPQKRPSAREILNRVIYSETVTLDQEILELENLLDQCNQFSINQINQFHSQLQSHHLVSLLCIYSHFNWPPLRRDFLFFDFDPLNWL